MPARLRSSLTYANVVSTLCLFILLGGSAYAAIKVTGKNVKDSSLTGKDIKNSSLGTADVKNGSLLAGDFKSGQLPAGPQGPRGLTGAQGTPGQPGEPATKLFAFVNDDGTLVHGRGATAATRTNAGRYTVTFNRQLEGCVAGAHQYRENLGAGYHVGNHLSTSRTAPNQLSVYIYNSVLGQDYNRSFAVVVFC